MSKVAKRPKIDGLEAIADRLGVTEKTVRTWALEHNLPVKTLIGRSHIYEDELEKWLLEHEKPYSEGERVKKRSKAA